MVETLNKNSRFQIQSLTAWNPTSPYNSQPFLTHTYCYVNCATGGTANNGNIWGITDTLNPRQTQGFTYDALNRISSFSLGGAISQQYKIDSSGNMSPMSGTNPIFSFDPATNRINNLPCAASLAPYDAVGNQICDTDNNGALRQYSFDAENRISQIAMVGSGAPFETYFYDGDGNRVRKANANGSFTEYVYFNGQPIAETDQSGAWTDYIYANGRKIAMDTVASTIWMHGSNETPVEAEVNLALPSVINITTGDKLNWYQYQQSSGGTTGGMNLIFDNGWQLNGACTSCSGQPAAALDQNDVAVDKWSGNFGWEWRTVDLSDYAGHSISGAQLLKDVGAPSDSWDLLFSFISINHTDGRVDTIYDGINQIGLSMPAVAGLENNWASYNGVIGSVQTRYYVDDHLGTTQMEFSAGGYPLWKGQFAPFGQELDTQFTANNYKFTGLERDSESGLDHTQFRQYGSTMGRWMSPDPYNGSMDPSNPQSFNRYSYVGNMPLSFTDPSGAVPCPAVPIPGEEIFFATCVGAVGGTAVCGPVCGAIAGGAALVGSVLADLFTGGFFAKPAFHGSLKPRPNNPVKGNCQAGPLNLSQNIETAKSLSGQTWSGLLSGAQSGVTSAGGAANMYIGLVQTGGAWDPKTTLGMTPDNIAAGNINFGATCSQFGFNTWLGGQVCQFGAGLYGKSSGVYGSPLFSRFHGDIPSDNQQIRQGLDIAKKGKC